MRSEANIDGLRDEGGGEGSDPAMERTSPHSSAARFAALIVLGLLIGFVGQTVSLVLWFNPQKFSTIWIPGGILLALLLLRPQREWLAISAGVIIGGGVALIPLGRPYCNAFIGYLVDCLAIMATARVLTSRLPSLFSNLESFSLYFLLSVIVLPALIGWVPAYFVTTAGLRTSILDSYLTLAPSHAMSFLLLTPLILAVADYKKSSPRLAWTSGVEAGLIVAGILVLSLGLWSLVHSTPTTLPLLLFAPVPLLLLAALRFGVLGASIGLLLVAIPAAWLVVYLNGPFSIDGAQSDVHFMQLWLLGVGVLIYAVAVQSHQQRSMKEQLATSRRRIRDLAMQYLKAPEAERIRISRELHDGINQQLAMLAIKAHSLGQGTSSEASANLGEFGTMISAVADDVRRIAHNLHPAILKHVGVFSAIGSLIDELDKQWDGALLFNCGCIDERPGDDIAICLYRIAQEGLLNAVKHSQARVIRLDVTRNRTHYLMTIFDDGCGFDIESVKALGGLGLVSMEERANLADGRMMIQSEIGKGTRLCIAIPAEIA